MSLAKSSDAGCQVNCCLLTNIYRGGDAEEMAWLADWGGEHGIKDNTGKTEVMVSSRRGTKANTNDSQCTSLRQVNKFKYLAITISEE